MKNRIFFLYFFTIFFSCSQTKNLAKKPIISIDSIFESVNLPDTSLSKVFTLKNEEILLKLDSSGIIKYIDNFRKIIKQKSNFRLIGSIGRSLSNGNYFMESSIDYGGNEIISEYRVETADASLINFSNKTEKASPITIAFSYGRLLHTLVPSEKTLEPINIKVDNLKSFSLEQIVNDSKINKNIVSTINNLANNVLVYNQKSFEKFFYSNRNYLYYPNYRSKLKSTSDFKIILQIEQIKDKYIIKFHVSGNNINMVAPDRISTEIELQKDKIMKNDFSEANYKISSFIRPFILMQLFLN